MIAEVVVQVEVADDRTIVDVGRAVKERLSETMGTVRVVALRELRQSIKREVDLDG